MTASKTIISDRFAGFRPLLRKEFAEWRHGRRAAVIAAVVTLFMALSAANSWIIAQIAGSLPPGAEAPELPMSMAPLDNLMNAVGSQIFVFAAIFGVMSVLVAERERGTLAWVASKPVARGAIWSAKSVAAVAVLGIAAVIVPTAITVALVSVLYGVPALGPVALAVAGMLLAVAFMVVVGVAASTVVNNQAAVAAIGFGVIALPMFAALLPIDVTPALPTAILGWTVAFGMGAPVGIVTPIAWTIAVVVLAALAIRRLEHAEL